MKKLAITLSLLFTILLINAQTHKAEAVFAINKDTVYLDEFIRMYNKNLSYKDSDSQNADQYLQLYITFKQKVAEAKVLKLDSEQSFINEFNQYKQQIIDNALIDSSVFKNEVKAVYNRLNKEVNASHILINIDKNATPADTLLAWNKAKEIKDRALKGEDFEKLAKEFSQDPSAKQNGGNLGYFGVFKMVYPFEKTAFETKKGNISNIVRTQFGYHIIKVNDIRESAAKRKAAHIMILDMANTSANEQTKAKPLIDSIYNLLVEGKDFSYLANKYSADKGSASKGGELPYMSSGTTVPEFDNVLFSMNELNSISKPFKTKYGWHIIKLLEIKKTESFQNEKKQIEEKLSKTYGGQNHKNKLIDKYIQNNCIATNIKTVNNIINYLGDVIYSDLSNIKPLPKSEQLFKLGNIEFTNNDFLKFLSQKNTKANKNQTANNYVSLMVELYKKQLAEENITKDLLAENPELRLLIKEYYEGILIFNAMEQEIWRRAQTDTLACKDLFNQNPNKYTWDKYANATIITFPNTVSDKKIKTLAKLCFTNHSKFEIALIKFNKKNKTEVSFKNIDTPKGFNRNIDTLDWNRGVSEIINDKETKTTVVFHNVTTNKNKTFEEAKSEISNELQSVFEKNWLLKIEQNHPATLNTEAINKICNKGVLSNNN